MRTESYAMEKIDSESGRRIIELMELPVSEQTATVGSELMLSDNIDESGTADITEVLKASRFNSGEPFRVKFSMLLMCMGGRMRLRLQLNEYEISDGDMLVILEGMIGECLEITGDSRLVMMAFSKDFNIVDSGCRTNTSIINRMSCHPVVHLSEEEKCNILSLYNILKSCISDSSFYPKDEMAWSCLRAVFCYVKYHMTRGAGVSDGGLTRRREILDRFLELIDTEGGSYHKLDYYSGRLCMTTKYMSRVVLAESGRSAREWIRIRLLLEAKTLLGEMDLTVQQISERMNFPNQSFFGSFFRKAAGITPGQYRRRIHQKG